MHIGLEAIGTICKQIRKQQGLNQDQAAERAGTTRSAVSAIENGRYRGALWALNNYLGLLGLTIAVTEHQRPGWDELDSLFGPEEH